LAKKEKEAKTNAMRILEKLKIPFEASIYEDSDDFIDGIHTADKLGLPHEEVYKTLVAVGKSKNYYVFVIPIAEEVDLKKAARAVSEKSMEMLPLKELTAVTGYIRGGCTAIGMKKQFPTVIHEAAEKLDAIYVSGGKRGVQLHLSSQDLAKAAKASFADIIK
jgi:Cys-tRNA(Pro)/Cys-tRNA(Cys) deacylase